MKLIGMMPVRNEDWILGLSARVALTWCDSLVILDHGSTDRTPQIISGLKSEYRDRIIHVTHHDPQWQEMQHRQRMLALAMAAGATHLAIIDADEVLTGGVDILPAIKGLSPGAILEMPGYNLRGGLHTYHRTGIWAERWFATAFAAHPSLHWSGDRFHHRAPMGLPLQGVRMCHQGQGGTMHLWGASERRLKAKHALYKMTETLRWPDKPRHEINRMYSLAFDPRLATQFDQVWIYGRTPDAWWAPYQEWMPYLDIDAVPWQEQACRNLYAAHGAQRFSGLNLFDVAEAA